MTTAQGKDAIRLLTAVPTEARERVIATLEKLSPEDRQRVVRHLQEIDGDLRRNEQKYTSSMQQHQLMLRQVEEHDLPAFRALNA